jgi:hypothetical protein
VCNQHKKMYAWFLRLDVSAPPPANMKENNVNKIIKTEKEHKLFHSINYFWGVWL